MTLYNAMQETLGELAVRAASENEPEACCRTLVRQIQRRGLADYISIHLLGVAGETEAVFACSLENQADGELDPALAKIVREAHGETMPDEGLFVPDIAGGGPKSLTPFSNAGLKSVFLCPIGSENERLGSLMAGFNMQQNFDDEQKSFLATLARWVTLAAWVARANATIRRTEAALTETRRAATREESLRALEVLAMGIAHKVNNALSPVTGYADMLIRNEKSLSEQARRSLKIIRESGKDIGNTVLRLDQFSRKLGPRDKFPPVSVNDIVREVVESSRRYWQELPKRSGIDVALTLSLDPELPAVAGSDTEIRQAVTNILVNAVDAMPQGGAITLATSAEDDRVLVNFTDSGTGMDQDVLDHCLEPFFTTRKEGSGMGLSVVYGVMQRHRGEIKIESKRNRGTLVSLIFRSSGEKPRAAAKTDAADASRHRILYVDDEPEVLEVMRQILETLGHDVQVAEGGALGISVFKEALSIGRPFDCVITDMGMPDVDGRGVATAVKEASPHTPVILFSGWSAQMLEQQGVADVVDTVVSKPPTLDKVSQMIAGVMRRSL